jgi:hypothetical protein
LFLKKALKTGYLGYWKVQKTKLTVSNIHKFAIAFPWVPW